MNEMKFQKKKIILKSFRSKQEERLKYHLVLQGSFFSTVITQALPKLNSLWSSAQ